MARREVTRFIDDVSGESVEDGERVAFALDGVEYEIDLGREHAEQLRDVFEPYIRRGRRIRGGPRRTKTEPALPRPVEQRPIEQRPVEQAADVAGRSSFDPDRTGFGWFVEILRFIWRLARMFGT